MTIKSIRSITGLNQREFAARYHIPLQTLKQWESAPDSSSHRTPPDYVLYLLDSVVLAEYSGIEQASEDNPLFIEGQQPRLAAYEHLLRAADDSRGDARLWYRYLRKEFDGDTCRIDSDGINYLLNGDALSMFQKVSLKRAAISGSPTNICIAGLNKKAATPILDVLRSKRNVAQ